MAQLWKWMKNHLEIKWRRKNGQWIVFKKIKCSNRNKKSRNLLFCSVLFCLCSLKSEIEIWYLNSSSFCCRIKPYSNTCVISFILFYPIFFFLLWHYISCMSFGDFFPRSSCFSWDNNNNSDNVANDGNGNNATFVFFNFLVVSSSIGRVDDGFYLNNTMYT